MAKILTHTSTTDNIHNVHDWPPTPNWGTSNGMSAFICKPDTNVPVILFVLAEVNAWIYMNNQTGSPTDVITMHATPIMRSQAAIAGRIVKQSSYPPKGMSLQLSVTFGALTSLRRRLPG